MNNEILKIAIKHKIYEFCIGVVFNNIGKNFPKIQTNIPQIGEKFIKISDPRYDECYYNCKIVEPTEMDFYEELEEYEKRDIAFAFYYGKYEYEGRFISRNEYQWIDIAEFPSIKFQS